MQESTGEGLAMVPTVCFAAAVVELGNRAYVYGNVDI